MEQNFFGGQSDSERQRREIERPIVCEACGSNWFTELNFNQYSDIAYGSGSGGDIRVISNTQQTIRVCVCGRPFAPSLTGVRGRAATVDIESFQKSLKLSYEHRKGMVDALNKAVQANTQSGANAGPSMDALLKTFSTNADHAEVLAQLSDLHDQVERLLAENAEQKQALAEIAEAGSVLAVGEPLPASAPVTAPGSANASPAAVTAPASKPGKKAV